MRAVSEYCFTGNNIGVVLFQGTTEEGLPEKDYRRRTTGEGLPEKEEEKK